ncbi:Uncharacterised protein [Mycobacteroides abscessus subsp. massiliense]|nr:Uncharacterised protein [Mycobacteroides abscessus subsp. massiliense]
MSGERRRLLFEGAVRDHLGGAVAYPYPGLRGGGEHHRLGVIGHGMLQRLMLGGDPACRAVVIGSVMQCGEAPLPKMDGLG